MIKIAVILPSRGLMFSKTADELLQNLQGFDYDIFFAHGLSIPECFELPLQTALHAPENYTHIWFVEDDMVLPESTLEAMIIMDAPVVAMDYPVSKEGQGTVLADKAGRVVFTGTGCLLVKRKVFDKISQPYFRTDIKWGAVNYGSFIRLTAKDMPKVEGYGLHDVTFGIKLWQADIPISIAGTIGQRKLIALGQPGTNDGAHQIEEWTNVKPNYLYKKLKATPPQPIGELISVITKEGEIAVHPTHAKKMIRRGVATRPKRHSISIDFDGVDI